jgi:hypothetical protein
VRTTLKGYPFKYLGRVAKPIDQKGAGTLFFLDTPFRSVIIRYMPNLAILYFERLFRFCFRGLYFIEVLF